MILEKEYINLEEEKKKKKNYPLIRNGNLEIDKEVLVAIDFDGTITKKDDIINENPEINLEVINTIKKIKDLGAKIILWTCREKDSLLEAINLCKKYDLEFDYINQGNNKRTKSRKINADIYIDDRAVVDTINWNKYLEKAKELVKNAKNR